jgi:hypothetical protein
MGNRAHVSGTVTSADVNDILAALDVVHAKLPFLITLSTQERREAPKMGEKSIGFDDKCRVYMTNNPEFIPGYVDAAEVAAERDLRAQVMHVFSLLNALTEKVDDTLMAINSEIWVKDLAYYQSVREAARRSLPGAETIYADLRNRFPGAGKAAAVAPQVPA